MRLTPIKTPTRIPTAIAKPASVQETNLRRESADFLTNFQNADGKVQLLTVAAGLFLGYKAFNAKNPLGRLMIWGGFGWWAYDRFINGNENALNDMTTGMKRVAQFSGEKFKHQRYQ